jgi:integrase/recombinase XerD
MSALRDVAEDYLRMRRALGYKLEIHGLHLDRFISYLEDAHAETVTIENALASATSAGKDPAYWAGRLSVVRQFARHLQTIDPACEVPPARLLPYRHRRAIPYLYQPQEITALMHAAGALEPPLLAANYQTLIGLLSVTGLRLGEAIRLDRGDVDARHRLLRIIDSKFGKSREVVLHDSTMHALSEYGRLRDRRFPEPRCEAFLVSLRGTRLRKNCIHHMFARLVQVAGLKPRSSRCRPRLHD